MDDDLRQSVRPCANRDFAGVVPKPGEGPLRKHYITNIIVTLADEDRASARSDYLLIPHHKFSDRRGR